MTRPPPRLLAEPVRAARSRHALLSLGAALPATAAAGQERHTRTSRITLSRGALARGRTIELHERTVCPTQTPRETRAPGRRAAPRRTSLARGSVAHSLALSRAHRGCAGALGDGAGPARSSDVSPVGWPRAGRRCGRRQCCLSLGASGSSAALSLRVGRECLSPGAERCARRGRRHSGGARALVSHCSRPAPRLQGDAGPALGAGAVVSGFARRSALATLSPVDHLAVFA